MSDTKKTEAEAAKQQIDIYKIRIEEYDRNFFSLRDLEWRTAFQFLSGYIAIAIAYHQLRPEKGATPLLFWWCSSLVTLLFCAFVFFRVCIQQRLNWARDRRNEHIKKLHLLQPDTINSNEEGYSPWGPYWYAIAVQLFIHFSAALTVLAFIYKTRGGALIA